MNWTSTSRYLLVVVICSTVVAAPPTSEELVNWKRAAESDISRFRMMATTTAFGGIKVSVPSQFREWVPVNAAAQAQVARANGQKPPAVPPGETPVYVQFTKFGVKGLGLADGADPFEWAATHNTPDLKLDTHWTFPQTLTIREFLAEFTVRIGDGRGISPRFDLAATLEDAIIPCDIHALSTTCLKANPAGRTKAFDPGRLTLQSKDLPLPRNAQRQLSQSLTAEVGPELVLSLPNQILQMPTPEQFLKGDLPPRRDDSLTPDNVERDAQNIIDGLRGIIDPKKDR